MATAKKKQYRARVELPVLWKNYAEFAAHVANKDGKELEKVAIAYEIDKGKYDEFYTWLASPFAKSCDLLTEMYHTLSWSFWDNLISEITGGNGIAFDLDLFISNNPTYSRLGMKVLSSESYVVIQGEQGEKHNQMSNGNDFSKKAIQIERELAVGVEMLIAAIVDPYFCAFYDYTAKQFVLMSMKDAPKFDLRKFAIDFFRFQQENCENPYYRVFFEMGLIPK